MERLAASVAHEINNPLSGILTYIYLMKKDVAAASVPPEEAAATASLYPMLSSGLLDPSLLDRLDAQFKQLWGEWLMALVW